MSTNTIVLTTESQSSIPTIVKNHIPSVGAIDHLVSICLILLNESPTRLSDSVDLTIKRLDLLARSIDSKLDGALGMNVRKKAPSISKFTGLKNEIINCLSHLTYSEYYEELKAETIKAVETSLFFNSYGREVVYDINSIEGSSQQSTMLYIYPCLNLLLKNLKTESISFALRTTYNLYANLIQVIDDLIDFSIDLSSQIGTPLTAKYQSNLREGMTEKQAFNYMLEDTKNYISKLTSVISSRLASVTYFFDEGYLTELQLFQESVSLVKPISKYSENSLERVKQNLTDICPDFLSYVP